MSAESADPEPTEVEPAADGTRVQQPFVYRSEELLKGSREVWIEHGAEMYRLRLTSSGKLYLTK